jgi:hypothetical protein
LFFIFNCRYRTYVLQSLTTIIKLLQFGQFLYKNVREMNHGDQGGLERDVVYLGWPIAPLYGVWAQMQIDFGDLTAYLNYVGGQT